MPTVRSARGRKDNFVQMRVFAFLGTMRNMINYANIKHILIKTNCISPKNDIKNRSQRKITHDVIDEQSLGVFLGFLTCRHVFLHISICCQC